MREIKFRAWDKESSEMIYADTATGYADYYFDFLDKKLCLLAHVEDNYPEKRDAEIMQFTGLIDKNGKEIYEGDIVRVYDVERGCICNDWESCEGKGDEHEEHGEHSHEKYNDCDNFICIQKIEWNCGYFCDEDTGDFCPPLGNEEIEMEIIGNIYENPELLK